MDLPSTLEGRGAGMDQHAPVGEKSADHAGDDDESHNCRDDGEVQAVGGCCSGAASAGCRPGR